MFAERCQQIRNKVAQLIQTYEAAHPGQKVPNIDIRFDLRGRAAGQAGRRGMNYFMRFNRDMMLNDSWDHLFKDTVPHELAHVICFANGSDRGHGIFWKRTCRALGGTGERCHNEQVTYAKGRTYVYTTSTGRTYNVSETKHRRIQQGIGYTFRDRSMGRMDRTCAYSLLGSPVQIKPVTAMGQPVNVVVAPAAQGASKADQIRQRLRIEKAAVGSEAFGRVVNWAVRELGMSLSLAKTYVKNNWNRV